MIRLMTVAPIRFRALLPAFLLLPVGLRGGPVAEQQIDHAGARFRVVTADPAQVTMVWKDATGTPYRNFASVHAALAAQGRTPRFLMNAGLFHTGGIPCGLYIEHGQTLQPLNLKDGWGNFHLKPNGVCWIETTGTTRKAFIAASETFRDHTAAAGPAAKPRVETAIQSGPLLLAAGTRHPAFREGSANRLHRNGVGIDAKGRMVFAITDAGQSVNLWDFAGLFLKLGCRDALYLDGDISQMQVNPPRPTASNLFGTIFVIAD